MHAACGSQYQFGKVPCSEKNIFLDQREWSYLRAESRASAVTGQIANQRALRANPEMTLAKTAKIAKVQNFKFQKLL
jgi:hypothetical protein